MHWCPSCGTICEEEDDTDHTHDHHEDQQEEEEAEDFGEWEFDEDSDAWEDEPEEDCQAGTLKRRLATAKQPAPIPAPLRFSRTMRFGPSLNRGYYSVRKLEQQFPTINTEAFVADLYSRKQLIMRNGTRLAGTAPYDHDPCLVDYHDAVFKLIENVVADCESIEIIVTCGTTVRPVLKERLRKFSKGDIKQISSKDIRI